MNIVEYMLRAIDHLTPALQQAGRVGEQANRTVERINATTIRGSDAARRYNATVGRLPLSIQQLNTRLDYLRQRQQNAFSERHIARYNRMIAQTQQEISRLNNLSASAERQAGSMGNAFKQAIGFVAVGAGIKSMIGLASGAEAAETQLGVLLGDAGRAKELMSQLTAYSGKTPYSLSGIQDNAKLMLSFGVQAERIMPMLRTIGDVAMGDAQKMSSLTLAFSQMSSTGRLLGQDLLQMINAGFNPLTVISEQTGKSIGVLKKEMEKGAISAKMVEDAFTAATEPGGRFYGMMSKMSETTAGKQALLLAKLKAVSTQLGERLLPIVNNLLKKGIRFIGFLERNHVAILKIAAAIGAVVVVVKAASVAMSILNATIKANPLMIAISLVAGLTAALFSFNRVSTTATSVQRSFYKTLQESRRELDDDFRALYKAKDGTDERKRAIEELNSKYGAYLTNLLTEKSSLEDITKAQNEATVGLARNVALKSRKEGLENIQQSADFKINEVFNSILDRVRETKGSYVEGLAASDLNTIIDNISLNPDQKSGELDFRRKYGIDPMFVLKSMNEIRTAVRRANYERFKLTRFYDGRLQGLSAGQLVDGGSTGGSAIGTPPPPLADPYKTVDDIANSGRKETNINISLGKLVENINLHVSQAVDGVDQLGDLVKEEFLRVLNSANEIATQ